MGTNMRSDLELLKFVYKDLSSRNRLYFGLCCYIWICKASGKISDEEELRLIHIINRHIVSEAYSDNSTDKRCLKTVPDQYFWPPGDITPRLKYLEYLIELCDKTT